MKTLRLAYRPPYDWPRMLEFLAMRALPGIEAVQEGTLVRVVRIGKQTGIVSVRPHATRAELIVSLPEALAADASAVKQRLRAYLDLDADPDAIAAGFANDALMRELIARRPGLRVPGALDPFEITVRAVLGQQVTVRAATTIGGRLVAKLGHPLPAAERAFGLTHRFPDATRLARADVGTIAALGMPGARAETLRSVARIFAAQPDLRGAELEERLRGTRGIGDWTLSYIAMRAGRHADAFPASDIGVRNALGRITPREAMQRAEAWRPWRAYAVVHLWTDHGELNERRAPARRPG